MISEELKICSYLCGLLQFFINYRLSAFTDIITRAFSSIRLMLGSHLRNIISLLFLKQYVEVGIKLEIKLKIKGE